MTTQRDAIGLSERLRDAKRRWTPIMASHPAYADASMLTSLDEAATQLDSLLEERFKLITDLAGMKGRAIKAEQERDALQARVKDQQEGTETLAKEHLELARDYDKLQARMKKLEAADRDHLAATRGMEKRLTDRAARLQQERDEAYERAASTAYAAVIKHAAARGHWPDAHSVAQGAAADVRRLAAGPEKEK